MVKKVQIMTPHKLLWLNDVCPRIQSVWVIFKDTTPYKTAQSTKLTMDRSMNREMIF